MQYLPAWLPGTGFQAVGRNGNDSREAYLNKPFQPVFDAVASVLNCLYGITIDTALYSLVALLLSLRLHLEC